MKNPAPSKMKKLSQAFRFKRAIPRLAFPLIFLMLPTLLPITSTANAQETETSGAEVGEFMKNYMGGVLEIVDGVKSAQNEQIRIQEMKLDEKIAETKKAIKAGDTLSAKIALSQISWTPIGNKEIDDVYAERYSTIRQLLQAETEKLEP